jgi:choline dehydrogenase-like flavoprotein
VIDCAAIPFIPSGNTNAAALMLGSRAVALIRNENAPPDALAAQRRAAA